MNTIICPFCVKDICVPYGHNEMVVCPICKENLEISGTSKIYIKV